MGSDSDLFAPGFAAVVDRLPDAVTLSTAIRDAQGHAVDMRLEYMNEQARAAQPEPAAAIGRPASELWPQLVENGSLAACLRVLDTGMPESGEFWWTESATYRPAGYEWRATRVGTDTLVWVLQDTSVRLAERWRLAESEAQFRAAFEGAPVGMCLLAPNRAKLLRVNASFARLFGRPGAWFEDRSFDELLSPCEPPMTDALEDLVGAGTPFVAIERRLELPGEQIMHALISVAGVRDIQGRLLHIVAHVQDVGRARVELLAHAATHDALTNLPNRTLLLDRVRQALANRGRTAAFPALLLIDLDKFQVINDSLGHAAGDRVLETMATRLRDTVRPGDTVARLDGDEFVVLCEGLDTAGWREATADIWRRIRDRLRAPLDVAGRTFVTSATAGIAGGGDYDSGPIMLRDANAALHEAKRLGRGNCMIFEEHLGRRAYDRLDVETGLRRALEQDEIEVHLQPLVDMRTEALVGAEALVRWRRDGELRPPGQFLDVAEETGLIVALSERAMYLAATAFVHWRERYPETASLRLAVNVAAQQVAAPGFAERLLATLDQVGLPPGALVVELTESGMMGDDTGHSSTLARLREAGVRVALDDFGTGFSAIGYLRRLPVDILKVDRAFVASESVVDHDPQALLRCFVDLGQALRLQVVIEGIEHPDQLQAARTAGFDIAQGYLLGRPVSLEQFEADHLAA